MSNHGENTLKRNLQKNQSDKIEEAESGKRTLSPLKEVISTPDARKQKYEDPRRQFFEEMKEKHPTLGLIITHNSGRSPEREKSEEEATWRLSHLNGAIRARWFERQVRHHFYERGNHQA